MLPLKASTVGARHKPPLEEINCPRRELGTEGQEGPGDLVFTVYPFMSWDYKEKEKPFKRFMYNYI